LYRYPVVPNRFLPKLAERLGAAPALGAHMRELDVHGFGGRQPDAYLSQVFTHTPHLRRLLGNGSLRLTYADLCALADTAGGTLEELSGIVFLRGDVTPKSPAVFARFTALRVFAWCSIYSPVQAFFDPAETAPIDGLPALEFLTLKSADALAVFSQMEWVAHDRSRSFIHSFLCRLPNLRRLSEFVNLNALLGTSSLMSDFMRAHGAKVWTLKVDVSALGGVPVLTLCPNMSTLACRVDDFHDYVRTVPFPHPAA
jgi:hypothetical protein